ncbi:MAG TPA: hypothetical protein VMI32_07195 [Candidatus Solibacter sp.]|nr:hypothetical protein [Candidatus Solibacter sp.]
MSDTVSQEPNSVSNLKIHITLRAASKPGSVKAHADVRIQFTQSVLEIFGLSIVQHDPEKPAWVSYPQRAAKNGKYYSHARASGKLHERICAAVLSEFERIAKPGPGPERAAIPCEPAEDGDIPF